MRFTEVSSVFEFPGILSLTTNLNHFSFTVNIILSVDLMLIIFSCEKESPKLLHVGQQWQSAVFLASATVRKQSYLSVCWKREYYSCTLKMAEMTVLTCVYFLTLVYFWHLPVISVLKPFLCHCLSSQIISVTGFMDADRDDLKLMAYLAGARYTGYLCRSNTVLICKE